MVEGDLTKAFVTAQADPLCFQSLNALPESIVFLGVQCACDPKPHDRPSAHGQIAPTWLAQMGVERIDDMRGAENTDELDRQPSCSVSHSW